LIDIGQHYLIFLENCNPIIANIIVNANPQNIIPKDKGVKFGAPGSNSFRISEPKESFDKSNQYLESSRVWVLESLKRIKIIVPNLLKYRFVGTVSLPE